MKQKLKSFLLAFPGFVPICRLLTRRHVRAIMYHRFSEKPCPDPRFIDSATLRQQSNLIARHHARWTPDDHLDSLTGEGQPAGTCPVVVTVDDGYHDFHDVAFPIFLEFGIPAMLFVTTGIVNGDVWFWWDKLEYLLQSAQPCRISVDVGGQEISINLHSVDGRESAWHRIADRCRTLPDEVKNETLSSLAEHLQMDLPKQPVGPYRAATWAQIKTMCQEGMLMGAHTVNHPILSKISSEQARREVEESSWELRERTSQPIRWFCYPQGGRADYTEEIVEFLRQAGYRGAYEACQNLLDKVDPYAMPRYGATSDMVDFRWILCGAEYLVVRTRKLLGLSHIPKYPDWAASS